MEAQRTLNSLEIDKLRDKITDIRIAMLTTQETDGDFHTRPMAASEMDPDGTMWFFTYDNSNKVAEIHQNNRVALGFSDTSSEVYVSVTGRADVVKDQAKINDLWNDALKTWFPQGKDDPSISLLKVTIHAGEFWDQPGGKAGKLLAIAKGALTGSADHTNRNEKFGDEPK
ncbi:pyridoxamine 5'-phosphate oxidase family protein [Spirosoma rhododendri]|uniref:Pyridoxamine 5'-phosphate oxidase family protein n=1 Tax=Spirosoma rhododendri TaxID=2728024 RepID=A0A7L5DI35_9BACT|nr:pyridoxamine 5'-phosphate oxidase family protein [Spirosoma rhododendri]QJD77032.1 pyridoxamine 5'-phosphate oxidase family protein [Spirosoma rhododendri]